MAAITQNTPPVMSVTGDRRDFIYPSLTGPTGSTLTVPLAVIYKVTMTLGTSATALTVVGNVITFTGGTMTNETVQVIGKP